MDLNLHGEWTIEIADLCFDITTGPVILYGMVGIGKHGRCSGLGQYDVDKYQWQPNQREQSTICGR